MAYQTTCSPFPVDERKTMSKKNSNASHRNTIEQLVRHWSDWRKRRVIKLCKDCKHCDRLLYCVSPQNMTRIDPVTGKRSYGWLRTCEAHRTGAFTGWVWIRLFKLCGKSGRWFEPKDTESSTILCLKCRSMNVYQEHNLDTDKKEYHCHDCNFEWV